MGQQPDDPDEVLRRTVRALTGGEPAGLPGTYLAVARSEIAHEGSTLPFLGARLATRRPSGLIAPDSGAPERFPIDLVAVLITTEDVGLTPTQFSDIAAEMERCPLTSTVEVLAGLLARLRDRPTDRKAVDRVVAGEVFTEPVLGELLSRIEQGGYLVTEYNLLKLMEFAFRHCYADSEEQVELESLVWMMLAVNEHSHMRDEPESAPDLGLRIDDEPVSHASALAAEMTANQYFNASRDVVSLIAQFQRRWRGMPAEDVSRGRGFNLDELYNTTVGVLFEDLVTLATMLWPLCTKEDPALQIADLGDKLSWEPERMDRALGMLARDREGFVAELDAEEFPGPWSFNAFERFPLFVESGRVVVLDPDFLINRVYGWLPIYDVGDAMVTSAPDEESRSAASKQMNTVVNYLRGNTERYVLEVLEQFAPRHGMFKRLWDEDELKAAYPGKKRGQVCDAVMEGHGSWVAFEVSSRVVQRRLASSASPEALLDDVMFGIVEKARQLEATLNRLKQNESNLTGRPAEHRRRFVPILVIGEGFPLGPITRAVIDYRLQEAGVLQAPEFRPLHILGIHELELLEYAVTKGGRELIEILDAHMRSNMAQMNLRDFLTDHQRPQRQLLLWERALQIATKSWAHSHQNNGAHCLLWTDDRRPMS